MCKFGKQIFWKIQPHRFLTEILAIISLFILRENTYFCVQLSFIVVR